jgi:hypothetical protein
MNACPQRWMSGRKRANVDAPIVAMAQIVPCQARRQPLMDIPLARRGVRYRIVARTPTRY